MSFLFAEVVLTPIVKKCMPLLIHIIVLVLKKLSEVFDLIGDFVLKIYTLILAD